MTTKITIDYEPGKVQGLLISKDQIIDPKPWPTDDIEGGEAFANESEEPKVFIKSFTFKMSEKANREFKRFMKRSSKLPRKLKKAWKHLYVGFPHEKVEKAPVGHSTVALEPLGTKDGYPRTRCVRKAEKHIRKQFVVIEKTNSKQQ